MLPLLKPKVYLSLQKFLQTCFPCLMPQKSLGIGNHYDVISIWEAVDKLIVLRRGKSKVNYEGGFYLWRLQN